jgi:asparagine synthase (glutamine-hydrolysing)
MNTKLHKNIGFTWYQNEHVSVKGYFYVGAIFYEKESALHYLTTIKEYENFKKLLNSINGVFTFVISNKEQTFIASDITRAFPLFYTTQNKELFFSDDILHLKNSFSINAFDCLSEIELKATNHTHGKKTLLKNVYQLQASECLVVKNNTIMESDFFFSYAINKESSAPYAKLKNDAICVFENTFKRLLKSLNNKPVVLPLSGGFDSRLIAIMFKKYDYNNVVCYTYGRKDSPEIKNSKATAKQLGFTWHFIEYTEALISNYSQSEEFKAYAHFAGKFSSMPYLQEYFAVKYLKEHKLIARNSVFIPGYAGDMLGGSQFLKVIPEDLKHAQIADLILTKKFANYSFSKTEKQTTKKDLEKRLFLFDENYLEKIPTSVFEDYDLKEKIAKFIFNSASFYTFFGFEHRFPYWDQDMLNFFKKVPVRYKKMKILFDDVLINTYFKPYKVYFESELQPSKKQIYTQKIKDSIKPILPTRIKQNLLQKKDWMNYKSITTQLLQSMRKNKLQTQTSSNSYNEIIARWYFYFSKNNIKK